MSYCQKNSEINLETDYECLIAFLINEMENSNSFFSDYFETLPKDFSTFPVMYKQEEKDLLKNSYFFKRLIKFELDVKNTFDSLKRAININESFSKFLEVYLLIQSRSFALDTPEKTIDALVPFGDMFNTSLSPKPCFWYFDDEYNFMVQASKDIKTGEEITIRYNDGHNTDYLLYYGFTIEDNPNGHIYDFEIISGSEKHLVDLNIKPSIKYLKMNILRKNNTPISLMEEINIYTIIRTNIVSALKNYDNFEYLKFPDKESLSEINFLNIKRVFLEEKKVLVKNLEFVDIIINAIESNNIESIFETIEISNYKDLEYFNQLKRLM